MQLRRINNYYPPQMDIKTNTPTFANSTVTSTLSFSSSNNYNQTKRKIYTPPNAYDIVMTRLSQFPDQPLSIPYQSTGKKDPLRIVMYRSPHNDLLITTPKGRKLRTIFIKKPGEKLIIWGPKTILLHNDREHVARTILFDSVRWLEHLSDKALRAGLGNRVDWR